MKLTPDVLREFLDYDLTTGVLTWRRRDREWFASNNSYGAWNTRYAGKIAGKQRNTGRTSYFEICIKGQHYRAHRVAWAIHYGVWPKNDIDHIDGCGINNAIHNLRDVTNKENNRNRRLPSNNSSGHIGVHRKKSSGKWESHIEVDGVKKHLGCFENFEDAVAARTSAQRKYGFTERHGRAS